ncbi:MAG: restriction endonuclease [Cryobacterium sp.]|nr:restriction endonuclease [Cryobacterium sp.]
MELPEPKATFLLDWQSAEIAALEHMKSLGFIDAQRTQSGADGGIDVESSEAAAQVKFYASPVGRPDIQRLRGAANGYRISVFYSTGGYTKEAVEYADSAGVALFLMDPYGNAEAYSQSAEVLVRPDQVRERQEQLEELKAVRYRLAALSFEEDYSLYAKFGKQVPLGEEEAAYFAHVLSDLDTSVKNFREAVRGSQFQVADSLFEKINNRVLFLTWITGEEFRGRYEDIDEAVAQGWKLQSASSSDDSFSRIASAVIDLMAFLEELFRAWEASYPQEAGVYLLREPVLKRSVGMLLSVGIDPSILQPELQMQLKDSVKVGVARLAKQTDKTFRSIFDYYKQLKFDCPTNVFVAKLKFEALVERISRLLNAS